MNDLKDKHYLYAKARVLVTRKVTTEPHKDVITTWQKDELLRDRLWRYGSEKLSTAELLSLSLISGVKGKDALYMSRSLLKVFGGIGSPLGVPVNDLTTTNLSTDIIANV